MAERRPLVLVNGQLTELPTGDTLPGAGGGGGAPPVGTATINFGAAPGDTSVSVTIADTSIATTSKVEAWLYGSTADNNAYEHAVADMRFGVESITAGTSFVLRATSDWFLSGTFNVAYRINN
jgi:hypothetical protein